MKTYALGSVLAVLASAGIAWSGEETGREEYLAACAGCHGKEAEGNGAIAETLNVAAPGLVDLAARKGGAFPFDEIVRIVDGREGVRMHGSVMPIWGDRFKQEEMAGASPDDAEISAQARLQALVEYLESIQQ